MIRKQDADILVWMAAMLAFAAVYIWNPPGPKYFPIEGVWEWEDIVGSPGMSWYARLAYAFGAAAISGASAWTVSRFLGHSEKALPEKVIYALTFILVCVFAFSFLYVVRYELIHLGAAS